MQWFADAIAFLLVVGEKKYSSRVIWLLLIHHHLLKCPQQALDFLPDWLSTTIMGMIGSFKSVLKSIVPYLLLTPPLRFFQAITVRAQWNVEVCCIGLLFAHVLIAFFGFVTQIHLLYFEWFIHEWRFMPESSTCRYYPIKRGRSVAPEIALKCNINAAILGLLPLWNTRGPSDTMATCYDCVCWASEEIVGVNEWKVAILVKKIFYL